MESLVSGQGELHKVKFNKRWQVTTFVYLKMFSMTKSCNDYMNRFMFT